MMNKYGFSYVFMWLLRADNIIKVGYSELLSFFENIISTGLLDAFG